jgi:predicted pyridoxine 5'-phosphate oxidase superfamily flavin-nucleotide-binding protein
MSIAGGLSNCRRSAWSPRRGPDGADVSPRGDPPGFVRILDARTLLVPDRIGNNRLDAMSNLLVNHRIGILSLCLV